MESKPTPDIFGYEYQDNSKDINPQSKVHKILQDDKPNKLSKASIILKGTKQVDEGLPKSITQDMKKDSLNIARGLLLNSFDIDIDKTSFKKVSPEVLLGLDNTLRDSSKVYVCRVEKGDRYCVAVINQGKVISRFGVKELVNPNSNWKDILRKSVAIYVALCPEKKYTSTAQRIINSK